MRWIEKGDGKRKKKKMFSMVSKTRKPAGGELTSFSDQDVEVISQLLLPNSSVLFGTSLFSPFSSTESVMYAP